MIWVVSIVLAAFGFFAASSAKAQEESSSKQPSASSGQRSDGSIGGEDENQADLGRGSGSATGGTTFPVRVIGHAGFLPTGLGTYHLGRFYLESVELQQVFDFQNFSNGSAQRRRDIMLLRSNFIYDRNTERTRIALQYRPRLSVVDGRVEQDFSNQDLNVDVYYNLTHRWTMSVADQFNYIGRRNQYGDAFFDTDYINGHVAQQNFLDASGSWISNSVGLGFSYQASARTSISIQPSMGYIQTGRSVLFVNSTAPINVLSKSLSYGSTVSLGHMISPNKRLGVFYSFWKSTFLTGEEDSNYHTVGVNYSQDLNAHWAISGNLGASEANTDAGRRTWTVTGSASIARVFRRSALSLGYNRGHYFPGYVSSGFHDRIDLGYVLELDRRWAIRSSIGYFRDVSSGPHVFGKYASGEVSYRLLPSLDSTVSYAFKDQYGDPSLVTLGTREFLAIGLRWYPNRLATQLY